MGFGSFVGESMHDDGSLVFAYYKEGDTDPTFIYFAYGLKEVNVNGVITFMQLLSFGIVLLI